MSHEPALSSYSTEFWDEENDGSLFEEKFWSKNSKRIAILMGLILMLGVGLTAFSRTSSPMMKVQLENKPVSANAHITGEADATSLYFQVNIKTAKQSEAKTICQKRGGLIASILSASEQAQAASVCTAGGWGCWIGIERTGSGKNNWKWADGSVYSYSNWGSGEPNNAGGNEACGAIAGGKTWNDNPCVWNAAPLPVLCERRRTKCSGGSYSSGGACVTCPPGHFCNGNLKRQCPAGQYQAQSGKSVCVNARCGHYVAAPGAVAEQACRAGTYQNGVGKTSCIPTPKGHSSPSKACTATKCPKGKYQDCEGQSSCREAPCGHFINSVGALSPQACGAGSYQTGTGQSVCTQTGPGTYAKGAYCRPRQCTPGFFQKSSGQSKCDPAACGHYVPGSGGTKQEPCPSGQWQPGQGQSGCISITAGFTASANKCALVECKPGEYFSSFKCVKTSCGHYTDSAAALAQKKCPAGQYQPQTGKMSCIAAPAGHTPTSNQCGIRKCAPGTYQGSSGKTSCITTKCGEIAPAHGMTAPEKCAAGSYQNAGGQTSCKPCAPGSSQGKPGQCVCPPCKAGFFQGKSGQTSCTESPCGSHVPSTGATASTKCSPGLYQDKKAQASCVKAPAGTYAVGGKCGPTKCPPGTYSSSTGMSSCTQSPCGKKVSASGATGATDCPMGYYQPVMGQSRCLAAPTGSHTTTKGRCSVQWCTPGHYQDQVGRPSCKKAACGHYVALSAAEKQNPCGPGRWQNLVGQTSCHKAGKGYYAPGPASCKQDKCPAGTYTDCAGQSGCEKAPCGHFVTGTGNTNYRACTAGTYQDLVGQSGCKPVPSGQFSGSGFCYAQNCDPGSFQALVGKPTCDRTKCGHYVDGEGAKAAKQCPAGSYQPAVGQTGCLPTTIKFAPKPGTCLVCGGTNLARGKPTGESTTLLHTASNRAVDGNANQHWNGGSCTATKLEDNPWWYADLGHSASVCEVKIWNRQDCCADRLKNFKVFVKSTKPSGAVSVSDSELCYFHDSSQGVFSVKTIRCRHPIAGRYVGVQLVGRNFLTLCEVQVFGTPTVATNWVLVARQKASNGLFPKSMLSSGKLGVATGTGNYMNLPALAQYNVNEEYTMKLVWPGDAKFTKNQIWKQKSNPWLKKSTGVIGYQPVSVGYTMNRWGGVEWGGTYSVLDGAANHGSWWWYAVGTFHHYNNGIPGPEAPSVKAVELYVKRPTGPYCSLSTSFDMPGNDLWSGAAANVQACQQKCLATAGCACFAADYPAGKVCWLKRSCPLAMIGAGNRQTGYCFKN